MLIEHPHKGDIDSPEGMFFLTEARFEFVCSAVWKKLWKHNDMFNGPTQHLRVCKKTTAESDVLEELKVWAREKVNEGAEVTFSRTWPITLREAPKGHRLYGKRDNGFLKVAL